MSNKIVLFDFDGVIADSFSAAFETSRKICPYVTENDYRKLFEGNIFENGWLEKLENHTDACRHDIDFFAEYISKMKETANLTQGMDEAIKKLAELYTLIIVSSGMTDFIKDFTEQEKLADYFTEIMGSDIHRSKVEKIKMVFSKYGARPGECVFITDTLGDVREAEQAGVGAIGVSWGFHDCDALQEGNPFRIVENPQELLAAVSDYFSGNKR